MSQQISTIDYQHFLTLIETNGGVVTFLRDTLVPMFENANDKAFLSDMAGNLEDRNAQMNAFIHAMKAALDKADENVTHLLQDRRDRARFSQQQVLMNIMNSVELDLPDEAELIVDLLNDNLDEFIMERFGEKAKSALRGFVYEVTQYQEETVFEDDFADAS